MTQSYKRQRFSNPHARSTRPPPIPALHPVELLSMDRRSVSNLRLFTRFFSQISYLSFYINFHHFGTLKKWLPTDQRTDGWTDTPSYRDGWTHLKTLKEKYKMKDNYKKIEKYSYISLSLSYCIYS